MPKRRRKKKFGAMGGSRPSEHLATGNFPGPEAPLPPLGELGLLEGQVLAVRTDSAGVTVREEIARCSCGGQNPRCTRCDGSGYYSRKMVEDDTAEYGSPPQRRRFGTARAEVGFSNDPRGDGRAIRELGRFESNPHIPEDY